jgi:hypothetical protein
LAATVVETKKSKKRKSSETHQEAAIAESATPIAKKSKKRKVGDVDAAAVASVTIPVRELTLADLK